MLDADIVEAVIQLPTDEFFNTGIHTYLWVLNKAKDAARTDKVMLIDASAKFRPLRKSKGSKRREVDEASRQEIVAALIAWVDPRLGGFASILLLALLARRLHRVALGGMYLVERERIRRGGVPSEALSGSGPALDGRSGAQEIAAMPTTEEEIR
jgi:type I restriction-modification system DNA methylase subunit